MERKGLQHQRSLKGEVRKRNKRGIRGAIIGFLNLEMEVTGGRRHLREGIYPKKVVRKRAKYSEQEVQLE